MNLKQSLLIFMGLIILGSMMFLLPNGYIPGAITLMFATLLGITIYFDARPPFNTLLQKTLIEQGSLTH